MKTISYLAFLASVAFATTSYAATTDVMGGMVCDLPAGESLFAPAFIHNDTFVGDIASISEDLENDTSTLSFSGVSFDSSEFAESSYPAYYIEVLEDGANQGYVFDVVDNGTTSLTVSGLLVTDFGIAVDDQVALRKHLTVGELFESAEESLNYADLITFFNSNGTRDQLFWIAPGWSPDFVTDHSDRQIYPGTGIKVSLSNAMQIVHSGKVRNSVTKVPSYGGAINILSSGSPVETTIGDLDLPNSMSLYESVSFYTNVGGHITFQSQYFVDTTTGDMVEGDLTTVNNSVPIDPNQCIIVNGTDTYISLPSAY